MTDRQALLISPQELAEVLAVERDVFRVGGAPLPKTVVLDVRWSLAEPDGREAFKAGHVPGAVYVDLESELSGHGPATEGRHPLPSDETLTRAARRWNLWPGDRVVAYDGGGNLAAARAWWLLRDAGVEVRLLDGAWPAWLAAGLPVETAADDTGADDPDTDDTGAYPEADLDFIPPGGARPKITLAGGQMPKLTLEEAASWARDAVLLDARAAERYSGETEPIDPRAGHVPGARSLPTTGNVDADGRFLELQELRARFEAAGVGFGADDAPVAAYCGSGITASHALFALELAGRRGALFPGSWSQWANHLELPVVTGANP